jgi:phage baseplate assembly protein W
MPFKSLEINPTKYREENLVNKVQIYKGFSTVNSSSISSKLYDFDLIKQDLLNQLYIRKGERVMSPGFGTIIWDILFDPLTEETKRLISEDLFSILTSDPRVVPTKINVDEFDNGLTIEVELTVVNTNQVENLRLTFDRTIGLIPT